MDKEYERLIANEFRNCIIGTIERIKNNEITCRPFHKALLSDDVIFWSAFERSFSTSFGQRALEKIAELVALSNGAKVKRQHQTIVNIDKSYEDAIHRHIEDIRSKKQNINNWDITLKNILSSPPTNQYLNIRVISDMWWNKDGIDNYISLKTVKPNIDQTSKAKIDCLRLKINDPNCQVYFGLPYNPYGDEANTYNFSPPMNIFDFNDNRIVLIGKDLWDKIGGLGCYDKLLEIAKQVGNESKDMISQIK